MIKNFRILLKNSVFTVYAAQFSSRPTASEVLTAYLMQCNEPPWTSYFVKVMYYFLYENKYSNVRILDTSRMSSKTV